jgi:hypothetical protein
MHLWLVVTQLFAILLCNPVLAATTKSEKIKARFYQAIDKDHPEELNVILSDPSNIKLLERGSHLAIGFDFAAQSSKTSALTSMLEKPHIITALTKQGINRHLESLAKHAQSGPLATLLQKAKNQISDRHFFQAFQNAISQGQRDVIKSFLESENLFHRSRPRMIKLDMDQLYDTLVMHNDVELLQLIKKKSSWLDEVSDYRLGKSLVNAAEENIFGPALLILSEFSLRLRLEIGHIHQLFYWSIHHQNLALFKWFVLESPKVGVMYDSNFQHKADLLRSVANFQEFLQDEEYKPDILLLMRDAAYKGESDLVKQFFNKRYVREDSDAAGIFTEIYKSAAEGKQYALLKMLDHLVSRALYKPLQSSLSADWIESARAQERGEALGFWGKAENKQHLSQAFERAVIHEPGQKFDGQNKLQSISHFLDDTYLRTSLPDGALQSAFRSAVFHQEWDVVELFLKKPIVLARIKVLYAIIPQLFNEDKSIPREKIAAMQPYKDRILRILVSNPQLWLEMEEIEFQRSIRALGNNAKIQELETIFKYPKVRRRISAETVNSIVDHLVTAYKRAPVLRFSIAKDGRLGKQVGDYAALREAQWDTLRFLSFTHGSLLNQKLRKTLAIFPEFGHLKIESDQSPTTKKRRLASSEDNVDGLHLESVESNGLGKLPEAISPALSGLNRHSRNLRPHVIVPHLV